ncbi:thioredoxin family protein [Thalassotalea sp. Y01]|uniref:protein-disulfide reductase DsbD family protein n=1 Tax=Thalassotalea sp. Y01 TaxID=2729613 RepID=UPI00145F78A3|nr:thioredoxin family protein [Thalassotalea sp. Y01]NMP14997.1 hypothetical protein [Thalassotalea sp. Y01]
MKRFLFFIGLYFFALLHVVAAESSDSSRATGPHIEVALLSENSALVPGERQYLGILLTPEKEWHTYWRNAGDSGEAPTVSWSAPQNMEFGDILWPLPESIPVAHLVNYGYSGANLLMVPVTLSEQNTAASSVKIVADLSWLVCKEDCIPGWATLSIELPVNPEGNPSEQLSEDATWFANTREQLPQSQILSGKHEFTETHLALSVSMPESVSANNWQLLPFRADVIQHNAVQQPVLDNGQLNFLLPKSDYFSLTNEDVQFLLTDGEQGYYLTSGLNSAAASAISSGAESQSLLWLMLLAFVGGLILNVMPCVLPVLSIKAMSMSHSRDYNQNQQSFFNKAGFAIGVLTSFWLFAAIILAVKASGSAVGWGFHLQEPLVIAALAFLFVFIALMLLDVAPTGGRLAGMGQSLTQGKGFKSQFFTGVLAVVVASPCTAPFMATALGVAMVSPAITTLMIFTALAVGFALPMTLLGLSRKFANLIPKPGAWMDTFKQFLAFPMLATVVWLVWVYQGQTGSLGQLWLLSGLLMFALFIWMSSKSSARLSPLFLLVALLAGGYTSHQGSALIKQAEVQTAATFSDTKLDMLRKQNQVVLVNMTADWCITCKVNEQVAFNDEAFDAVIADEQVHYMVGDWTNKNQQIFDFLTRYQRSGVPLYVVYAGEHYEQVLPQVLTTEIVINAIEKAQQEIENGTL